MDTEMQSNTVARAVSRKLERDWTDRLAHRVDLSTDDRLEQLAAWAQLVTDTTDRLAHEHLEHGGSFTTLGRALGITRQAAWKRFHRD